MAVTLTTRLGITQWGLGTDPYNRAQMNDAFAALEAIVAIYSQGTIAARPLAGVVGRFYAATDTGFVYYDTGVTWIQLNSLSDITSVIAGTGLTGGATSGDATLAIDTTVVVDKTTAQTLLAKTLTDPKIHKSINNQTGVTYTPVLADDNRVITVNNASPISIVIETDAVGTWVSSEEFSFAWIGGAGQATITGASGVTIISNGAVSTAPKLRVLGSVATALRINANTWLVFGDIS